jgi:CrcB protein
VARAADVVVAIAIGSGAGGVARYLLTSSISARAGTSFPLGTFVVNVSGCLAIGFLMRLMLDSGQFSPTTRAFFTTGLCGGFTTFSTFSWETIAAIEEGALRRAALYALSSVVVGLACVWLGSATAQLLLRAMRGQVA